MEPKTTSEDAFLNSNDLCLRTEEQVKNLEACLKQIDSLRFDVGKMVDDAQTKLALYQSVSSVIEEAQSIYAETFNCPLSVTAQAFLSDATSAAVELQALSRSECKPKHHETIELRKKLRTLAANALLIADLLE